MNEWVQQFREEGYALVPSVFPTEEAAEFRREAHALIARLQADHDVDATWASARESAAAMTMARTALLHCHDVQFQSAALARLLTDPRLTDWAAAFMGTPNVQLHHNKLFIKPPEKGSPFPMHQDKPFFPHERDSMIAAVVHFDDAPLEKGCLRVVPGTHQRDLPHIAEGSWHLNPEEWPVEDAVPVPAKAGDVVFFHYRTVHGSGINGSSEARTTLLIQMRDPEDRPTEITHISRGQGMMLRGIDPRLGKRWADES